MGFSSVAFSRPPNEKERAQLTRRLRRLERMQESVEKTTRNLIELVTKKSFTEVVIRPDFVRLQSDPGGFTDPSDRGLPPHEDRPPASRLISPRGASLRLYLTALFEAQASRSNRAGAHPMNIRPLTPNGHITSWIDLIASDAQRSGKGRTYMSVNAKKARQVKYTLDRLVEEELVFLPNAEATAGKHEQFQLMDEGGRRRQGEADVYKLPRTSEAHFSIPVTLFTHGWIHVLEDSELAVLLMLASRGAQKRTVIIPAEDRLLLYGIGRDAYEAHQMLDRLNLIDVTADPNRHPDGKIQNYNDSRVALLHRFDLLTTGFEADAFCAVYQQLTSQLDRQGSRTGAPPSAAAANSVPP